MIKADRFLVVLLYVHSSALTIHKVMALSSSFVGSSLKPWRLVPYSYKMKRTSRGLTSRSIITMMPEGPEVRTLVDQLQGGVGRRLVDIQFLSGRYVRNGKPDGFQQFAATMTPDSQPKLSEDEQVDMITSWQAKGKFIYIILDNGKRQTILESMNDDFQRSMWEKWCCDLCFPFLNLNIVLLTNKVGSRLICSWITLGMTGKFVSERVHARNEAHGRWYLEVLDLESKRKHKIHYHDARNFGTLKFCLSKAQLQSKLASLGPDILEPTTTEDVFLEIFKSKNPTMNICKFLMNQSVSVLCLFPLRTFLYLLSLCSSSLTQIILVIACVYK